MLNYANIDAGVDIIQTELLLSPKAQQKIQESTKTKSKSNYILNRLMSSF